MRVRASVTHVPYCMRVVAKPFFILMTLGPWRAMGHVSAPKPSHAERQGPEPGNLRERICIANTGASECGGLSRLA
jgi:hypothetical protein